MMIVLGNTLIKIENNEFIIFLKGKNWKFYKEQNIYILFRCSQSTYPPKDLVFAKHGREFWQKIALSNNQT